jgi:hypothetical protein
MVVLDGDDACRFVGGAGTFTKGGVVALSTFDAADSPAVLNALTT